MPASNNRALEKAPSLDCDGVIFDLEDSLADEARQTAHDNLRTVIPNLDLGTKEKIIRLPELEATSFADDLGAAMACGADALLIPKVESGEQISRLSAIVDGKIAIWAMIETPRALIDLKEICETGASSNLECLVVGPNDLAKTTGARMEPGRTAMMPWLMQVLAVGRAFNLCVLDGVYNNFRDGDGLQAECRQGASMGYDGKTLIHPAQIQTANQCFGITEEELSKALAIVDVFALPENRGKAVVQLDGEMVEHLHLSMANQLISAHKESFQ